MNWGAKITILYVGFVALILGMVTLTMRQKVDLVAKDYYEQELNYQQKINRMERTNQLLHPLTWEVKPNTLRIRFPREIAGQEISGKIYFFRPSDSALDQTIPVKTDTLGVQNISTELFNKGLYKIEISWETNGQDYYKEGIIQLN